MFKMDSRSIAILTRKKWLVKMNEDKKAQKKTLKTLNWCLFVCFLWEFLKIVHVLHICWKIPVTKTLAYVKFREENTHFFQEERSYDCTSKDHYSYFRETVYKTSLNVSGAHDISVRP